MPFKYINIPYHPNPDPMPHVHGRKLLSPKNGVPTYESRLVMDASGFLSDYLVEQQDRWKGDQGTPTLDAGNDNGLSMLPRQPYNQFT